MSRKKIIILAVVAVLVLVAVIVNATRKKGFQPDIKITTDSVTGEKIRTTNNTPEEIAQGEFVTILGAAELSEQLSQAQIARFRENVNIYLNDIGMSDVKTIKIIPGSVIYTGDNDRLNTVKAEAILGETNQKIQLQFTLLSLTGIRITYTNPSLKNNSVYKTENLEDAEEDDGHIHEEGDLYLPPEYR